MFQEEEPPEKDNSPTKICGGKRRESVAVRGVKNHKPDLLAYTSHRLR